MQRTPQPSPDSIARAGARAAQRAEASPLRRRGAQQRRQGLGRGGLPRGDGLPDIYDLGMSNLGLMILYGLVNDQPDMFADRVYSPWTDMEAVMRREEIPLYGLRASAPCATSTCWRSRYPTSSFTPTRSTCSTWPGCPCALPSAMSASRWCSLVGTPVNPSRWLAS